MTDASSPSTASPLTPETWVVASSEQVSADLEDETVILGMRDAVYYGLDGVGSRVWTLAASATTLGALHAAIVSEYEVDPVVAWDDLVALARDLLAAGLLERAAAPPR